ncbi:DEAD/DEAH box helicase [Thioalkalivibrio sp. ALE20]|uniref:DEAD/DEAH box helicase n=1 Tax=Thioalkalivibrio sp. ALE20 TaxID=545275 RepID=UPI00037E59AD|nr:DEAD/DEAH box helicase [Thioalkalivibrio sp. ALE20]
MSEVLAPGMRVEIRDAEWRIRQVDTTPEGERLLTCEGLSELVRGRQATFLPALEARHAQPVRVLDPRETELEDDLSANYTASLLHMEAALRSTPATGEAIHVGHRAALDALPYQLDPARQALAQPRPRILIADAVGLGKTLEAGILTSELIARGRGQRILVLAVKSMLAQFQQEFWNRFTIPLVRLDSVGLQRVRSRIPTNHNPFHYFDRSIISIDTLKQDIEYRHYLEQARWDIIIIDEAHNVADRGSRSQRARLAQLLATRSDALIMLSATPHDGRAESFASLMNMLDPTAISNPSDYAHEDFRDKGLVIRRFKKDVQADLASHLPEREIAIERAGASAAEEAAYAELESARFRTLDGRGARGARLFRTTLKKALYSSPAACRATIETRLRNLQKRDATPERQADIDALEALRLTVDAIDPTSFSKYQRLLRLLGKGADGLGWSPRDSEDRLVIFTESIRTLEFLAERLPADLGLKQGQLRVLRGDMPDREQMAVVEAFGAKDDKVRVLVASDVAAEGINLHYRSHRLIHFDVPWSLMTFQQRNGRIDRYGQTRQPQIRYLVTESDNPRIRDEQRVLEVLVEKDEQAGRNIGDPSEFMAERTVEEQEATVSEFIEDHEQDAGSGELASLFGDFLDTQQSEASEPLDAFVAEPPPAEHAPARDPFSLFESDFDFAATTARWLRDGGVPLQVDIDRDDRRLALTAPPDLGIRLAQLPREARPEDDHFILTPDRDQVNESLRRHDEDSPWAERQYLWSLHPVVEWLVDRARGAFGRHTAPLLRLPARLAENETAFLLQGGYPNRRGYPLVQDWLGFVLRDGEIVEELDLPGLVERLQLHPGQVPNRGEAGETAPERAALPAVVERAQALLDVRRREEEARLNVRLNEQMEAMDALEARHKRQLELELETSGQADSVKQRRREQRMDRIERIFRDYQSWLEDTQMIEKTPYIQVIAAFTGRRA